MDNLVVLNNWLEKHSNNDQDSGVLLLEFSKICRLCLKESLNMYGIRNHLVEFEEGSLFLQKVIANLIDEVRVSNILFIYLASPDQIIMIIVGRRV